MRLTSQCVSEFNLNPFHFRLSYYDLSAVEVRSTGLGTPICLGPDRICLLARSSFVQDVRVKQMSILAYSTGKILYFQARAADSDPKHAVRLLQCVPFSVCFVLTCL